MALRGWDDVAWSARVLAGAGFLEPLMPDQLLGMGLALRRYGVSIAALYAAGAARSSRRAALRDEAGALSFGELDDRTGTLAVALRDRGVAPGDRLGVLCRNGRAFVEATVALAKLGADTIFLNTGMAGPQLAEVFVREGGSAIVLDEEFLGAAASLAPKVPRFLAADLDTLAAHPGRRSPPVAERSGGQIVLTSGTTGLPKGAHRSGAAGLAPLLGLLSVVPLRRGDVTYVPAPLFHAWGFFHLVLGGLLNDTVVLRRRFDAEGTLRLIEEERVTVLAAVPVMLQRIMELPDAVRARYDTSSLRVVVVSGSALAGGLATRFMDAFGDVLYNLYGSTEVAWATVAGPAELRQAPNTAGRPPRGTVVRLLDEAGKDVAAGAAGRIFVGNGLLFSGYTGGGSKPVVDGLMATGDIGRLNDRGLLFVEGRVDDMIVSGGENVFPLEVEDLLLQHPGIADACVVGVADDTWGQRLRAVVVTAPGAEVTAEDVKGFVRRRLAAYKVPRDVVFGTELPRNATGKVLRRQLAD